MLIQLLDMQITNIQDETWEASKGCETCDYGQLFATEFIISFSNNTISTIRIENGSPISYASLIQFFANTEFREMSKKKFLNSLCSFLKKEYRESQDFQINKS